jgi:hypothetical protein
MTALLVSLLLALPQETAEDAFKKVEAAIEAARTIRVTFTLDASSEEAVPSKGTLAVEEDGRTKLEATLRSRDGQKLPISEDCDGKTIVSVVESRRAEGKYDPKYGRSNYNVYLSRTGVLIGVFGMHGFYSAAGKRDSVSLDLKQIFEVRNVKFAESRRGMTGLTYELKAAFEPMPIDQVKIWYDPNNYKIARREYRLKHQGVEMKLMEDYLDVQFGVEKAAAPKDPAPSAPVSDAEMENLFFKAKMTVAESHFNAGRKSQAVEILEEIIKTYPKHPGIPDARRLLDQAKKK